MKYYSWFIHCMHMYILYICVVSGEIQLILDNTTSELIVNEDVGYIIISISLSEVLPQQFAANYRLVSGTASEESLLCSYICVHAHAISAYPCTIHAR